MLVLIGCEYSATIREAFKKRGHDAYSCDLRESEVPGQHLQCDLLELLSEEYFWDLVILHPPCTHLAVSGARWFKKKREQGLQQQGIEFFMQCALTNAKRLAVEQPVSIMSTLYREPDQYIEPWMFGHKEPKKTCLWLTNLPKLIKTNDVYDEMMKLPIKERNRIHHMPPGEEREKERSRTYQGIADAMAEQWGAV